MTDPARVCATVELTAAGPKLFIFGVLVHWYLGCIYDEEAQALADEINKHFPPAVPCEKLRTVIKRLSELADVLNEGQAGSYRRGEMTAYATACAELEALIAEAEHE